MTRIAVTVVGLFSAGLGVYTIAERFVYGTDAWFYVPVMIAGSLAAAGSLVGIWVIWTKGGV